MADGGKGLGSGQISNTVGENMGRVDASVFIRASSKGGCKKEMVMPDAGNKNRNDERAVAHDYDPENVELIKHFKSYGTDLQDPYSWRARVGRIFITVTNTLFDLAEKVLVVSAFSAAAKLTSDINIQWLAKFFGAILAVYIIFLIEDWLARGFALLKWRGMVWFAVFVAVTMLMTLFLYFALVPAIEWLTNTIAKVGGSGV